MLEVMSLQMEADLKSVPTMVITWPSLTLIVTVPETVFVAVEP